VRKDFFSVFVDGESSRGKRSSPKPELFTEYS
jgi:hypothetical protein